MIIGLNAKMNVWRITTPVDDEVGGAVVTGTMAYRDVNIRIQGAKPEMILLQQGLEVPKMFTIHAVPASLDISERDEVEISSPATHPFYMKRMVVRGVQVLSMSPSDPRNYLILYVSKKEFAHAN